MKTEEANNKRIREIYRDLLGICKPFIKKTELGSLRKSFEFVLNYHRATWEETGEEYIFHSIEVAKIALKDLNLGIPTVICALLHNVVDHHKIKIEDIKKLFGEEISILVEGYVRLSEIQTDKISIQSENFRKLYLSLVKDIRVILIKLAHRLYDMRRFDQLPEIKKQRVLTEVNHIYTPIAHRLGYYNIKTELEDLWLMYSFPEVYKSIDKKIKESKAKQNAFIRDFISPIDRELFRNGFTFETKGRPKSIHSTWQKMRKQEVEFEEIYDLFAIRIIIDTPKEKEKADCWRVYSIVTDIYKPNPQRLRDWISSPKATGYESLHTTVASTNGKWVEVQIRSARMDLIAEQGLASHWRYKEGSAKEEQEEWMNRIRDLIAHPDSEKLENSDLSKIELYSDKIFILTPEGDLKKLPHGSTVLDFAYDIHTNLGDMCSGARVNGRNVPIRHILKNGDKVEVITSKNQKPKLDWMNFVVTTKAKGKIKRAINELKFHEAENGKEILRRKLRNSKIQFSDAIVDKLIKKYKLKSAVDLYYLIATEKIDLADIKKSFTVVVSETTKLPEKGAEPEQVKEPKPKTEESSDFMFIDESIKHLGYELAKCCNPVHGDAVFGFVTVGKGITIHRISCPNARQLISKYDYRVIDVKWRKTDEHRAYHTTINVSGNDEIGILNNITQVISNDLKVNMVSVNVDVRKDKKFAGKFKVIVKDTKHLSMLINKIMKIKGVKKVVRSEIEL
jgi:GTP pyrophosphokinase